jgi:hypothetical protein
MVQDGQDITAACLVVASKFTGRKLRRHRGRDRTGPRHRWLRFRLFIAISVQAHQGRMGQRCLRQAFGRARHLLEALCRDPCEEKASRAEPTTTSGGMTRQDLSSRTLALSNLTASRGTIAELDIRMLRSARVISFAVAMRVQWRVNNRSVSLASMNTGYQHPSYCVQPE